YTIGRLSRKSPRSPRSLAGCHVSPGLRSPTASSRRTRSQSPQLWSGADMLGAILVAAVMSVTQARFGAMPDSSAGDVFTLTNAHGVEVRVITYGAAIASIKTPDRDGRFDDIVTGFDTLDGYLTRSRFFGAIVGRYANRIANARFTLNGRTYELAANNGK